MLIDTHCHLADPAFEADREAVLVRSRAAGVRHVVIIGETPERAASALALARREPDVSATAGLHPHEARHWSDDTARWLEEALRDPAVVAVGETGLDYHYDFSPREQQRAVFETQLTLAAAAGRPAVIHAREADPDVISILRNQPDAVAILHSFSSGPDLLRAAVALGHYVSWSGMITFRNWQQDDLIREVPADRLLVETDSPFLAPVPHRGKTCEPAFVRNTAEFVAGLRGEAVETLAANTTRNFYALFGKAAA